MYMVLNNDHTMYNYNTMYIFNLTVFKFNQRTSFFSAEYTIGMASGLTLLKHYGNKLKALWQY